MAEVLELSSDGTWVLWVNDKNVSDLVIPEGVTEIDETISVCKYIETVKLPSSLERIGEKTFSDCMSLKSIDIPSSVSLIESDAFEFCYDLTTVIIRSRNITIEYDAFRIDLNDIVLKVDNLDGFSIDEDAFFCVNFTDCTLHIPAFLYIYVFRSRE